MYTHGQLEEERAKSKDDSFLRHFHPRVTPANGSFYTFGYWTFL